VNELQHLVEFSERLTRLVNEVQTLVLERERMATRLEGLTANHSILLRQRIALEAIVSKCDEVMPPSKRGPKSPTIERIRSLACAGLDAGNEVR
jgi:hypothetical protein